MASALQEMYVVHEMVKWGIWHVGKGMGRWGMPLTWSQRRRSSDRGNRLCKGPEAESGVRTVSWGGTWRLQWGFGAEHGEIRVAVCSYLLGRCVEGGLKRSLTLCLEAGVVGQVTRINICQVWDRVSRLSSSDVSLFSLHSQKGFWFSKNCGCVVRQQTPCCHFSDDSRLPVVRWALSNRNIAPATLNYLVVFIIQ